jgi:pyruvate,orthophosphate dikinase
MITSYKEKDIYDGDPFVSVDRDGVGELMKIGVEKGRSTRPQLKLGICGEHGGDPRSVEFCHEIGLDYVSCSPYRIPIARLAAAQAALKERAARKEQKPEKPARSARAKVAAKSASAKVAKVRRAVAPAAKSAAKSAVKRAAKTVSSAVKTARRPLKKAARGRVRA